MKRILVTHSLHNIINVNKIASAGYWELAPNFNLEEECFNTWKLTYVDTGEVVATTGKTEFPLKAGDIIFNKPNDTHDLRTDKSAANVFVMTFVCHSPIMNYLYDKSMHLNAHQRKLISWILEESEGFFDNIRTETPHKNKPSEEQSILGREQMIRIHLEHLLILLARGRQHDLSISSGNNNDFNNELVKQIAQFLEENIYNNITLEEICKKFNYGNTYICTLFKEETGYSIMNYYTKKKIDLSKKFLREGLMNITQISDYLNFCNPHYFSYVFKKFVHMSPREYQQSLQSDVASIKVKRS